MSNSDKQQKTPKQRLTLWVDKEVSQNVKAIASLAGESVSQLLTSYINNLAADVLPKKKVRST